MKHFINAEALVWLALIALSIGSVYGSGTRSAEFAYVVLAIAFVKCALIFFVFMEMRHAHRAWRIGMTALMILIYAGIACSL